MMRLDSAQLSRLKDIEFEILVEIDRVCKKAGLVYWLDSGTLLGAARHQGFIPWDDDIDIGMPRSDYERFLKIAPEELADGYSLCHRSIDRQMLHSFAKVRKDGTRYVENATSGSPSHQGIWVDIFPFDSIEGSPQNLERKKREWKLAHKAFTLRAVATASTSASAAKAILRKLVRLPLLAFPKEGFYSKLDRLADDIDSANGYLTCFHYSGTFVELPWGDFIPTGSLAFEGREFPVPNNWERYLAESYGDWRELPPPDKRQPHHDVIELDFGEG